jgi:two-component system, cell cycle response regulator DivK
MKQILLIDDDPRNIFALKSVLKAKGLVCLTALSAEEGFALLNSQENNIGIILIDMMMPDMDGYEAITELRKDQRYKDIPVISVTAQAMVGDKEKCLAAGANAYISKPINIDLLMAVLTDYLK